MFYPIDNLNLKEIKGKKLYHTLIPKKLNYIILAVCIIELAVFLLIKDKDILTFLPFILFAFVAVAAILISRKQTAVLAEDRIYIKDATYITHPCSDERYSTCDFSDCCIYYSDITSVSYRTEQEYLFLPVQLNLR